MMDSLSSAKDVDKGNANEASKRLVAITQQKKQLARLSILLDEAFTLPVIGVRVGWDAIIGLIPIIGDGAGAIISSYFVYKALRFKMPFTMVARMLLNIGIELIIGIVPLVGDVLDVAWKANRRNYRLMEGFFKEQEQELAGACQQQGISSPVGTDSKRSEPKKSALQDQNSQESNSQGHFVMLLVFVLIVCSVLANRGQLESLVSSLEHESLEHEVLGEIDAKIDNSGNSTVPTKLEVMTSNNEAE